MSPTFRQFLSRWLRISALGVLGMPVLASPFTYQGRLVDGAALANGNYELTFRLFDDLANGSQVGSSLVLTPVGVTNGLFTVDLDFGNSAFTGASRWLELSARVVGAVGSPETLAPRQAINAVPYAIRAFAGSGNATELTTGTLPDARLSANIPRAADVNSLSNILTARIAALESALGALSNQVQVLPPAGVAAVSSDPADAALTGDGWSKFSTVPAPSWSNGNTTGTLTARSGHSAVWTGQSWLIWGGVVGGGIVSDSGAGYDPVGDQWSAISELNSPAARQGHSAVWTGSAMLVWGGFGAGGYLGTGGSFSPTTGNWGALATSGAPAERNGHTAVWTGSRMVVWGGRNAVGLLADGAIFDPAGAWSALPALNAPEARTGAIGLWAGTQFFVWGGQGALGDLSSGALLPITGGITPGAWTATSGASAPSARSGHTAVWTGSKVLVWGGKQGGTPLNSGAAFNPADNSWSALPTTGAPSARSGHVAVWTGDEMLIFGGQTAGGAVATGGAFNPATGKWRTLSSTGSPVARTQAAAAWSGSELLVFGGLSGATPVGSLQRLNPQPTWYFYRKP